MVYETDFYTTRRPYRYTPSYSTYTTTTTTFPSRQVRILPGLGKVHIVHSYDRLVPYVGHKRLTVVTTRPNFKTNSAVLQREYDWIENRIRPWVAYSAVNNYLNSDSAVNYGGYRTWKYYSPYFSYLTRPILYKNLFEPSYSYWYDRYLSWCDLYPRYGTLLPRMVYRSPLLYTRTYLPISNYQFSNNYYWPYSTLNYLSKWWPKYYDYYDDDLSYRALRIQRIFENERNLIRAQTAALLKSVHLPVPRVRNQPLVALNRYGEYPARLSNDYYINRLMQISPKNSKVEFTTYYTEPVKKYIGQGHLSCVSYVGDRSAHNRRRNVYIYEDPVKNDIQLLSFYINKFREEKQQQKAIEPQAQLSPSRPSRRFNPSNKHHIETDTPQEIKELREARAARLAKINEPESVENVLSAKKKQDEARLAEETAAAEAQAAQEAKAKREKEARDAELKRQEEMKLQQQQAELEKQREEEERLRLEEETRKLEEEQRAAEEEAQKRAEEEALRKAEEERLKAEEERLKAEEARLAAEEEERRKQEELKRLEEEEKQRAEDLQRLEEIARQAEEEKERELARQAEELAELARQEAELAELAKQEAEASELKKQEDELAELKRQEEELEMLEKQLGEAEEEETAPAPAEEEEEEEAPEKETEDDEPVAEAEEADENTADEAEDEEEEEEE